MSTREVELSGGAPWGFRMHGGADQNQPLRISRVNPGRKASLSGVREGDVISSINGRPTRTMSNADAHAMLRAAGPVLRLGLNEGREMSPRRRSIGKGGELKRPSPLVAEEAIPQEPVYATIKPPMSQNWSPSSPLRSSLNSLPSALNSTPLVKAAAPVDPPKFHPTNPFYTTLPSNYSSASKLPVPNGKSSISSLDRSKSMGKSKDTSSLYDYCPDLKSPSYFSTNDYGSSSHINSANNFAGKTNGYEFDVTNSSTYGKSEISYDKGNQDKQSLPNDNFNELKNPFRSNRINSDPFEKYLNPEHKVNGKIEDGPYITNSMSDNNFQKTKEITERSTITEHKISEIEEVKTIKKIFLNGSSEPSDQPVKTNSYINMNGEGKSFGLPQPQSSKEYYQNSTKTTSSEHFATSPTQNRNDNSGANNQNFTSPSAKYHFVHVNNESSPSGSENDKSRDPPEAAIQNPPVNLVEDSPTEPDLDPEILSALGDTTDDTPKFGEKIHTNLAQRWLPILKKGLPKETKDQLFKEYLVPDNCQLLQAPKLNAEIAAAVTESVRVRDKKIESAQQQLGVGVAAINKAMTLLLTTDDKIQAIKYLGDGCRILSDLHHNETKARIKLLTPGLAKPFLNVIQDCDRDETLFGSKISDKIKASKIVEKQGLQIKKPIATSHKTVAAPSQPSTSRAQFQGNWTGPSRYSTSRGGGRGAPRKPPTTTRKPPPAPATRPAGQGKPHAPPQQ